MIFKDLNLNPLVLKALDSAGHVTPTAIQEKAIPEVLAGRDILASASTGTGKTAAFMLPILSKILGSAPLKASGNPRVLILSPTRELALQINVVANLYGKYASSIKITSLVGGMSPYVQRKALSRPCDIVVATPGRLLDHMQQGTIRFSQLEVLVIDEADRMLDMGFIDDVTRIIKATPASRQTLLFSATLDATLAGLVPQMLKNPVEIAVAPTKQDQKGHIEQHMLYADNIKHKNLLLKHFLSDEAVTQTIIFTSTKRHVAQLVDELRDLGHRAAPLHGDMSQAARNKALDYVRRGSVKILVATDVAARGIDIAGISHVINFDLPRTSDDYIHRIGRTGRAGASGVALSFVSQKDFVTVKKIEHHIGSSIPTRVVPGLEPQIRPPSRGSYSSHSSAPRSRNFDNAENPRSYAPRRSNYGNNYGSENRSGEGRSSRYGNSEGRSHYGQSKAKNVRTWKPSKDRF